MRPNLKTCNLKFQFKWAKNVKFIPGNGVPREPKMLSRELQNIYINVVFVD